MLRLLLPVLLLAASLARIARCADNGLALVPPRGFITWGQFRCNIRCDVDPDNCISESLIHQLADVMVSDHWVELGYTYLNLDDCWQDKHRDASGNLQADAARFPAGMNNLSSYLHERHLKFGVYTDYGTLTCMGRPGSYGFEAADARQFAAWGVDMVKMDGCYKPDNASYNAGFPLFGTSLNATGRPILFSCSWPDYLRTSGPAALASVNFTALRETCNIWRIYDDIQDDWWHVVDIAAFWAEQQGLLAPAAGPGAFNDPDMLIIGQNSLGVSQMKAQMSLWVVMAAPLFMAADLRSLSTDAKGVLQNPDVLRVADDPLGKQGLCVQNATAGLSIWRRELAGGDLAVLVLNTMPFHANKNDPDQGACYDYINNNGPHISVGVSWEVLGWDNATTRDLKVADLWASSRPCCQGPPEPPAGASYAFAAFVPFSGCRFFRVSRAAAQVVVVSRAS
jgi:alpha-N-acetylgalactosaminidase